MFSEKLWELFLDSFPKILLPGLTMTIPLTAISFTLALLIAVAMALVQFANVPVLRRVARFYIWIFRGTPLLVQLSIVFYGLSRVGIAPDREEKYNFSTPYAFNRTAVLVRGDGGRQRHPAGGHQRRPGPDGRRRYPVPAVREVFRHGHLQGAVTCPHRIQRSLAEFAARRRQGK